MNDEELDYISYATDEVYHKLHDKRLYLTHETFRFFMDEMMKHMGYIREDGKYRRSND